MRRLDRTGVCGWIVDLHGNNGGSMDPMIRGRPHARSFGSPTYGTPSGSR
ncbi:hypothetical protein ABZ312_20290 [Streptomyces sp. NPDC006207]